MEDIGHNPMQERQELLAPIEQRDGKATEQIGATGSSRRLGTWYTHRTCFSGVSSKGNI
jgi:hypothetical protein